MASSHLKTLVIVAVAVVLAGCGGSGTTGLTDTIATKSPLFTGGRSFNFSGTNSSQSGSFEVVVRDDGSFEPNGAVYLSRFDGVTFFSDEGDVTTGHINHDGYFVIEAFVNKEGWPRTTIAEPYVIIATGRAITRGAHYEGGVTVGYYDWSAATGRADKPRKLIDYDLSVYKLDRSRRSIR